ncbi:hypothetical protein M3Y97_01060100 [Aphelenchoides bicaudatus]|nr:hypothetical protein M3Y97_01060100 [Aphelenchoides bicaudatus]
MWPRVKRMCILYTLTVLFLVICVWYTRPGSFRSYKEYYSKKQLQNLYFNRPCNTRHIPCSSFFDSTINLTELALQYRIEYDEDELEDEELGTDCVSIFSRSNFFMEPMSKEESEFSIAYARNVNTDYHFHEITLSTTYAPQNFYCYSIDGKADETFVKRLEDLTKCLPNVFVTDFREPMTSLGILKWYGGANDITTQLRGRKVNFTWDFESLHLFKDSDRNRLVVDGNMPDFLLSRGAVQSVISHEAVDFIVNKLDLNQTIFQLNSDMWSVDEYLTSSINSNDNIQLPGGFTRKCYETAGIVLAMNKYNVWLRNESFCKSKIWRHGVCVFGAEDLLSNLLDNPFFVANKMVPTTDFGAIVCWNEVLFNRTYHDRGLHRLNKRLYTKLPHVRYHKAKKKYGVNFDFNKFDCAKHVKDHIGTNILPSGIYILEG